MYHMWISASEQREPLLTPKEPPSDKDAERNSEDDLSDGMPFCDLLQIALTIIRRTSHRNVESC